jgi:hypothetical protein
MRDQHYRRITTRMSLRSSGLRKRVIPKSVVAVFGQDHAQEKGSGTPADAFVVCPYASGVRDAPRKRRLAPPSACGRARLPAFHYGSHQRDFRPEGSASGQASRKRRESCGVPHAPVFGHSDAPRAPVVMPAGMMPEPPGCGVYLSARGRRTRSALREYPPRKRPFKERDWLRLLPPWRRSQRAPNFLR